MNKVLVTLLLGAAVFHLPLVAEEAPKTDKVPKAEVQMPQTSKININTATETELQLLKGIGQAKAKAIVEYRNQYGRFASLEDLTKVAGVGQKVLDDNKDLLGL
ncbi:ComEA family DNA-binding protein [Shewanella litorisediminis]|uniref:Helix-hairpin-helix domain-containing protein n=1 Tax=Shewanella litorisediminis TaxID=1173586 RepID=A0ABX7G6R9_9GAMM|nr:ComEA family DNA-binding protein [Shewanella litorisediminis]MCL2916853.1 helix-hairpin-helix domain-containing protein [Shewanella litorisediminis]QRH02979.1 helix-hairpin-helix domain-containing protein [Shewanella litorisediminis]